MTATMYKQQSGNVVGDMQQAVPSVIARFLLSALNLEQHVLMREPEVWPSSTGVSVRERLLKSESDFVYTRSLC